MDGVNSLDNQTDQLVYKLCGLTPEENAYMKDKNESEGKEIQVKAI